MMIGNTHLFVFHLVLITVLFILALREFVLARRAPDGHPLRSFAMFNGLLLLVVSVGLAWGGAWIRGRYDMLEDRIPSPAAARMAVEVMAFVERDEWVYETKLSRDEIFAHYESVGPTRGFTPVRDSRSGIPVLLLDAEDPSHRLFVFVEERENGRRIHVTTKGDRSDVLITTTVRTP
ncbi:MAG TPA: hypothetical protein VLB83_02740 [Candidatus Paceibacterota bacterium]|nr:hypothetical protein [Candidatus Paceibacterota bacterium]